MSSQLLVGVEVNDDAGVWQLPSGETLVQTVDYFTPIVDDPYDWGRIAAANALSDIYAMGGKPLTALQLINWPRSTLPFSLLSEVIRGGAEIMGASGTTIVGGHSIDDPEPKYGFAVTGSVAADQVVTNAGAKPGDALILTKPLGMGIVTTALKHDRCPPELARQAIEVMASLNALAVEPMHRFGVHAATDVTGFGLLGHLREMLAASGVSAILEVDRVPVLPGVDQLVEDGTYPGGSQRNLASVRAFIIGEGVSETGLRILADAQTSGGLLIAVPPDRSAQLLDALTQAGSAAASEIGRIETGEPSIRFRLS
jgi:selenide,water dikinase